MNGKSDETLGKTPITDERPPRTNFRLVSREERQPEPMRPGEIARKTPETASQHASQRHWGDDDDDPGPTAA
jgi:hypothetical protein